MVKLINNSNIMKKIFFLICLFVFSLNIQLYAKENFFEEAKNKYDKKKNGRLKVFIPEKYCI